MKAPATLVELLTDRAGRSGEAIHYLDDVSPVRVSGAEVLVRAQRVASALKAHGVKPGDRVLLMLSAQIDVVDAFFGCVWAGAVAVPLFPPMFALERDDFVQRFIHIANSAQPSAMLVATEIHSAAAGMIAALSVALGTPLAVLTPPAWQHEKPEREPPDTTPEALAFLQYTSGSTGMPKGVMLSHRNVMANVEAIGQAIGFSADDVGVSWLPLYHDMGLIGGLLSTLRHGARLVSLSPLAFAKRPERWLFALSEHGGTLSPAPNFAFRRCLSLSDDVLKGLDLSRWRIAFNGAEPVEAHTLERFLQRFAPYGLSPTALFPVYGLAEHTLAVTFPPRDRQPKVLHVDTEALACGTAETSSDARATALVGVGQPLPGVSVVIRDEHFVPVPAGHIGHITVQSQCVMMGYFNNIEATTSTLIDGWLLTGDLGFFRDGELFITGRQKDLIIRAGRKYAPQDIEAAAQHVPQVRAGRAVAIAVPSNGQDVVTLVCEVAKDVDTSSLPLATTRIKALVATRVGFAPEHVVWVKPATLPLTSSGKLKRQETLARHQGGQLDVVDVTRLQP